MSDKTVNIRRIRDCQIRTHGEGFNIELLADSKNNVRTKYVLHFKGAWWARWIAEMLWKVVAYEQTEVDRIKHSLVTDPSKG